MPSKNKQLALPLGKPKRARGGAVKPQGNSGGAAAVGTRGAKGGNPAKWAKSRTLGKRVWRLRRKPSISSKEKLAYMRKYYDRFKIMRKRYAENYAKINKNEINRRRAKRRQLIGRLKRGAAKKAGLAVPKDRTKKHHAIRTNFEKKGTYRLKKVATLPNILRGTKPSGRY